MCRGRAHARTSELNHGEQHDIDVSSEGGDVVAASEVSGWAAGGDASTTRRLSRGRIH
jgi:hypothetical protein